MMHRSQTTSGTKSLRIRLQYIHEFRDRHGRIRRYFRRPGSARIRLPGAPGSAEFMEVYQAALGGFEIPRREIGASRSAPGSVSAAIAAYYVDSSFAMPLLLQRSRCAAPSSNVFAPIMAT